MRMLTTRGFSPLLPTSIGRITSSVIFADYMPGGTGKNAGQPTVELISPIMGEEHILSVLRSTPNQDESPEARSQIRPDVLLGFQKGLSSKG